jgi:hypothetical protein
VPCFLILIRGRGAHRRVMGRASEALNEARILLQAVFVAPEIDRPTDARRGQKAKLTGTPSGAATRSSAGHARQRSAQPPFGRSQLGTHRDAGRHRPQLGEQVGGHHQPSASVPGACNDAGPTETTITQPVRRTDSPRPRKGLDSPPHLYQIGSSPNDHHRLDHEHAPIHGGGGRT